MQKILVGLVLLLLAVVPAAAQKLQPTTGIMLTAPTDGAGNACTVGSPCATFSLSGSGAALASLPAPLTTYGTLSVATTSVAVNTATAGPSAPAFALPPPNKYWLVKNSINSASVVYVCWLGGTCTASVGVPIAIGEQAVGNLGSSATSPTVISTTTATVIVEQ